VDGHPDDRPSDDLDLTYVDAHAHTDRNVFGPDVGGERPLAGDSSPHRLRYRCEGDEERVALGATLLAPVRGEGSAQELAVLQQDIGVPRAKLL
jgi:hypothetical protein